jgi:hypothetical protein
METVWFCLVAIMIAMYVVLDGFDLGAGAIHLLVAKTEEERRLVIHSIGPVWDGNEVWLLAAGGTLFFAFPVLYASGFSGFYLPLMIVLWLLILRGISIEFRGQLESPVWLKFWDVVFAAASLLLTVFFGAALGNVVRGVPLNDQGYFFEALWTNFRLGANTGILDWYTILVGLAALFTLGLHAPSYRFDFPCPAACPCEPLAASLGLRVPRAGVGRAGRNGVVHAEERRPKEFPRLLRLLTGNADECGVWIVPPGAARQLQSRPFTNDLQR